MFADYSRSCSSENTVSFTTRTGRPFVAVTVELASRPRTAWLWNYRSRFRRMSNGANGVETPEAGRRLHDCPPELGRIL